MTPPGARRAPPSPFRAGLSHLSSYLEVRDKATCATSPRVRGEVDLRAEPLRSEANRVRGLVHKLRLAATPPHPDSFAALGIRPLPASGERWSKRRARCHLRAASRMRLPCLSGEGWSKWRAQA